MSSSEKKMVRLLKRAVQFLKKGVRVPKNSRVIFHTKTPITKQFLTSDQKGNKSI